jgi:hypothetical protein
MQNQYKEHVQKTYKKLLEQKDYNQKHVRLEFYKLKIKQKSNINQVFKHTNLLAQSLKRLCASLNVTDSHTWRKA